MWQAFISPITDIVGNVLDKVVPDAGMAEKLKFEITKALIGADSNALEQQAKVIMAEANGESWLQRNWRPITALTFVALVVAHWLGLTAPNITQETLNKLLDIIQIMIGGYTLSRGAEKVMREYKR